MHYLYYKKRNKMKYFLIGIILCLLVTFICLYVKYHYRPEEPVKSVETVADNRIDEGIMKTKHIYLCGHDVYDESEIPHKYIGKTLDEIKDKNKFVSSAFYENNILNIEIKESVKCDKHYRIQLIDDFLNIFCEKYPDKAQNKIKVNLIGLYQDEVELLKNGIEFGSKESMLEFLEDFES